MEIKAIQFLSDPENSLPSCLRLQLEGPQALERFKDAAPLPCGLVVTAESLSELKRFKDLVTDRGRKNKHKGLGKYLLGLDPAKIPLVAGSYDSAGRLIQGMRAMTKHAADCGDPAVFVVGADEDVFEDLWAGSAKNKLKAHRSTQKAAAGPLRGQDGDISSWLIQELGVQCQVPPDLCDAYIGESEEAALVRQLIMLAAQNDSPTLILGDTGTGKEIVARQIHRHSLRQSGPFIPVNCGGIPEHLLESELFGHVAGAFTGAARDKVGLWQAAAGGTLFLDEIAELRPVNQVKILRALSDGKTRRVGDTKEIRVDARIIAATNRDLFDMVQTGRFREDLYYRLRGFFIRTPALRNHPQDIAKIAHHLWRKITGSEKRRLPREVVAELSTCPWTGNVRELKMVLSNLFNLFPNENLNKRHLRSVSFLAGRATREIDTPASEKDILLHRAGCLRHLKRAHEVVDATEHLLKKVLSQKKRDAHALSNLHTSLHLRFHELEKLCRSPLLFHGQQAFTEVNTLKGRIAWLLGLVPKTSKEARNYWRLEVAGAFRVAMKAIFAEIEKLLAQS